MSIYLLYSDEDSPWARTLVADLRDADLPIWFADDEIGIGDSIPEATSAAIQGARVFLVILSKSALKSRAFTHRLSGSFHQLIGDPARRVMPVLRESCDIPPMLQDRRHLDLSEYAHNVASLITELWNIYKENDPTAPDIPGYESFKYIGEGGFGVVYKCFSKETSQECAVKIAKAHSSGLPIDSNIAKRIPESSHIVPVVRSGQWRKRNFIVMPYVGRSLKSAMRLGLIRRTDVERILQLAEGILNGLSDAHKAGIVHRDIKPSNILLDDLGRPLICDFGLATKIQYTQFRYSTVVRGTICYMSPEQQLALETNQQTDIYSFGAVLYELLTNEKPFGRFRDPSEVNKSIPPSLDALVSRCLEVALDKRYKSAKQVLQDLSAAKESLELGTRLRTRTPPREPIFSSGIMKETTQELTRISELDLDCLLLGPIGSGKSFLATWSHTVSRRHRKPFIVMSAAGISESLALAEMFGYERGAYTGATQASVGLIGQADGGTLFVDDVDYLPLQVQVMLLRVVDEGMYRSVGSTRERKSDVRFIFASNKDLFALAGTGQFNPDLLSRMRNVVRIAPLSARKNDLPSLINYFAERLGFTLEISPDANIRLFEDAWPGNVRELAQLVEFTVRDAPQDQRVGPTIVLTLETAQRFFGSIASGRRPRSDDWLEFAMPIMRSLRETQTEVSDLIVAEVRQRTPSDGEAAKILEIDRKTLRRYLEDHSKAMNGGADGLNRNTDNRRP